MPNNQFGIDVVATLNTDNVPKQLNDLNAKLKSTTSSMVKIPVGIDTSTGERVFSQFVKDVKKYADDLGNTFQRVTLTDPFSGLVKSDSIKKIKDSVRTLTTETHKFTNTSGEIQKWTTSVDEAGQKIQTRIKQYINDSKELVTETTKWGRNEKGQWEQIGDTVRNVTDDYKKSTQILTTETHKFVDNQGAVQKWTTTIDDSGKVVSTRVKQVVDDMGNLTTTTSKLVSEGTGKPFKKMGDDIVQVSEILKETTTQTTTSFGKITDTINGVTKTFDGTITTIKKMSSNGEELTTEISKYVNEMGQAVEVTKQFDKNGNQVATTMRKISEATDTKKATFIDKDGNKTITEYKDGVAVLRTEVKKYTDEVGNLITQTDKYDAQTNQLISTHQDLTRNVQQSVEEDKKRERELENVINKINEERQAQELLNKHLEIAREKTTTTHTTGTTQQFGQNVDRTAYDALITTIEKVNEANETVIETTYKFINAEGELVEQIRTTDKEGKKLKADIINISDETEKATRFTEEYAKAVGKITTKNSKTSTFIDKDGNKIVTEYIDNVATLRTEIKTYTDQVGNLITQTDVYNAKTNQLISTHQELTRDVHQAIEEDKKREQELANVIEKINQERLAQERLKEAITTTTTTHSKGKVQQFGSTLDTTEYDALITKTVQVNEANEKVIKTTYEFTNAQGQLVRQTRTTDGQLNKLAEDVVEVSDGFKRTGESAERANHGVKNLGWNLGDAISRLSNFYIASLPIRAVQTAITETISTVKDFDSALIEFRKVSDLAGDSLTKYVAKLAEMGEVTGSTMQAMVEASTEFRKSGFSDEDSAQLASIAEKYRNIADEEISAGESASFIIAQMKAFNVEAGQAEHIIDSVNEVANNFSVSSADLAKNLGNMSEIMAINNVSMEEQIGMLTGVTEITRNASSASRGLVMISSRLTQVLDDTSSTGKKLTKIYNDLGIELKDENGQLRSHYDILGDLAGKWNTLSENQQKYIALTSAGARQQQNFVALMANWSQVANATTTAYQSMGSAQRENEKVMDSVAKKVEILKSQFQQLVIGKGGLQDFAKKILDIGIALLKFANSDVGKTVIKVTELIAIITLLNKGILALPKMAESLSLSMLKLAYSVDKASLSEAQQAIALKAMGVAEGEATVTTGGLAASFEALTAAMMANPIMLVVTGLVLLAGALIYASKKQEEYNERIRETKEEIQELKNEIYNLKLATEDEAKVSQAEKDKLKYLEKRLELQKKLVGIGTTPYEEAKERATQAAMRSGTGVAGAGEFVKAKKQAEAIFNPKLEETELGNYIKLNKEIENWNDNSEKGLELLEQKFNQSQSYLTSLEAERDRLGKLRDTYAQNKIEKEHLLSLQERGIPLSEEENKRLEELSLSRTELSQADAESLDVLEKNIGAYHKSIDAIKTYQEAVDEYGEGTEEADSIITEFAKDLQMSEEEFVANADAMHLSIDGYYEYAKAVKQAQDAISQTNTAIDGMQDALNKAQAALSEYNQQGFLTVDTFQDLMSVSAQYLTALINENGQIVINQESLGNLVEVLKQEKIEELQAAETADILAYAHGEVERMSGLAKTALEKAGDSAKDSGKKAAEASGGYWSLSESMAAAAAMDGSIDVTHIEANLQKIHNAYAKLGNTIKSTNVDLSRSSQLSSKAGRSGASGAKSATDAQKELNKELEETIKKYETVIKYINKRYDREIKKIKDAKSEAIKAEEKKIKAKEKEKDHALDAIEKEIDALKKEQDARKKYWSDRIDTLKKQNDALKDSLELQEKLDALEKARNTRVKIYKEGQGFVYDVDQTAVAQAQKELDEYLSQKAYEDELERLEALKDAELDNYEKRLDALNEYKDSVQENYEKQIEQMNEYKDQLSEQYDAQIDKWEEYKEQFGDLVDQYEEQQNKLLFEQLMGIKDENSNWLTRLDNLAEFVRKYNELQNKLNTGDTNVTNTAKLKDGTGGGSGTRNTGSNKNASTNTTTTNDRSVNMTLQPKKLVGYVGDSKVGQSGAIYKNVAYVGDSKVGKSGVVTRHANGIGSINSDEIAVVGENPNKEIVIGSKINNGELMNLGKGTGVVNADSSKTLAGMLNQVGQFGASGFGSGNGTLNSNINNDTLTINGVTIQGSNIKDPETFVNGLLNLKAEALQRAYKHR